MTISALLETVLIAGVGMNVCNKTPSPGNVSISKEPTPYVLVVSRSLTQTSYKLYIIAATGPNGREMELLSWEVSWPGPLVFRPSRSSESSGGFVRNRHAGLHL